MSMANELVTYDENGEVIEDGPSQVGFEQGGSMVALLQRAEIDQQITTAHAFPRKYSRVQSMIMNMVTLDRDSAEECLYALPRGGKEIIGPSVRFAEAAKQAFGNCRASARVIHVDRAEKYIEAEGVFHDLETNSATSIRVRRRISDSKGRLLSEDMIIVTGNAACSIAKRNAILDGIPKPLWRAAFDSVKRTIAGDVKTLAASRVGALEALGVLGMSSGQVFSALGVGGFEDITLDHIVILRGMHSALKSGEATVEEMIATTRLNAGHSVIADPLATPAKAKKPAAVKPAEPVSQAEPSVDEYFNRFIAGLAKIDDLSELAEALVVLQGSATWGEATAAHHQAAMAAHRARGMVLFGIASAGDDGEPAPAEPAKAEPVKAEKAEPVKAAPAEPVDDDDGSTFPGDRE
jgi:hypothetical protein